MPLFPLFADLSGREVLVVGGGEVATRKVEALLHAGAQVQVHAHALGDTLSQWLAQGRLRRREGDFDPPFWTRSGWSLPPPTTSPSIPLPTKPAAPRWRHRRHAELSHYMFPADRRPLAAAVAISSVAPRRARRLLREHLSQLITPSGLAALLRATADIAGDCRTARRRRWFSKFSMSVRAVAGGKRSRCQAFQRHFKQPHHTCRGSGPCRAGTRSLPARWRDCVLNQATAGLRRRRRTPGLARAARLRTAPMPTDAAQPRFADPHATTTAVVLSSPGMLSACRLHQFSREPRAGIALSHCGVGL